MSKKIKIMLIDNYDSFVYNLADEFRIQYCDVSIYRANMPTQEAQQLLATKQYDAIVFSPGPGAPEEARLCLDLLSVAPKACPILGICLGHQCIIHYFGGIVSRAEKVMHGKQDFIKHTQKGLFQGLKSPLEVARYHSLIGVEIPDSLVVDAHCDDAVMAVRHQQRPVYGLQFHPESILTPAGPMLIHNFLSALKQGLPHE